MKQLELLTMIAEKVSEITGKSYRVDYSPHRNISEESNSAFRCVYPGSLRLETVNRSNCPVIHQSATVGIFAVLNGNNQNNQISDYQEELITILKSFMSVRNPVILQKAGENERATVEFGECNPVQDSGIVLAGLQDDPPVIVGSVTLGFKVC